MKFKGYKIRIYSLTQCSQITVCFPLIFRAVSSAVLDLTRQMLLSHLHV
jgi:hypothetical protein